MPISFKNSSFRISPGWGLRSLPMVTSLNWIRSSMIVDNLNIMTVMPHPPEANAPLIVAPDIYLAGALALEHFEPVSRWDLQILDRPRCIHLAQLSQGPILDLGRE